MRKPGAYRSGGLVLLVIGPICAQPLTVMAPAPPRETIVADAMSVSPAPIFFQRERGIEGELCAMFIVRIGAMRIIPCSCDPVAASAQHLFQVHVAGRLICLSRSHQAERNLE
jgi:hypothetical protein